MGIVGRRRFKKWVREVSDRIKDAIESVADGDLVREMDVAFELNSEGCLDPRVLRVQVRVERYGTIENLPEKPAEIPLGTASAESGADPAVSGETTALLGAPGAQSEKHAQNGKLAKPGEVR